MKKKQSATGIFFSMFLRAVVVILAIVIVCLIVALVRSLIHGKNVKDESASGTGTVASENQSDPLLTAVTTEATTEAPKVDYGIKIAVLNGTQTNGLAGAWKEKLNGEGYTSVEAGNFQGSTENTKIYVLTEGKGPELAAYFQGATTETGELNKDETDVDITGMDVLIIIGTKDDILSQN